MMKHHDLSPQGEGGERGRGASEDYLCSLVLPFIKCEIFLGTPGGTKKHSFYMLQGEGGYFSYTLLLWD